MDSYTNGPPPAIGRRPALPTAPALANSPPLPLRAYGEPSVSGGGGGDGFGDVDGTGGGDSTDNGGSSNNNANANAPPGLEDRRTLLRVQSNEASLDRAVRAAIRDIVAEHDVRGVGAPMSARGKSVR